MNESESKFLLNLMSNISKIEGYLECLQDNQLDVDSNIIYLVNSLYCTISNQLLLTLTKKEINDNE